MGGAEERSAGGNGAGRRGAAGPLPPGSTAGPLPAGGVAELDLWKHRLAGSFPRFIDLDFVLMPPDWRNGEPMPFSYVLFDRDLDEEGFARFFQLCSQWGIPNPRPFDPRHLRLASLFHPVLYGRLAPQGGEGLPPGPMPRLEMRMATRSPLPVNSPLYYMQSLLFLAGCTLSAAVVQQRFSRASIESKLNRLWQLGHYARSYGIGEAGALDIEGAVRRFAGRLGEGANTEMLIDLKAFYGRMAAALDRGLAVELHEMHPVPLSKERRERFRFVDYFRDKLGANLVALLVYGSAVDSESFGDYDLIVLVNDEGRALRRLAGTFPRFHGKELNVAFYDSRDFPHFQAFAGENMHHNGLCLFGSAQTVAKPREDLMARNFSFGHIRLNQLLGLAGSLSARRSPDVAGEERGLTLYEYFIKIPLHIMKGVYSASGHTPSKEELNARLKRDYRYRLQDQLDLVREGRFLDMVARAYVTSLEVVHRLNEEFGVFGPEGGRDWSPAGGGA